MYRIRGGEAIIQHSKYLTIQYVAEKSLFTVVQPPMTFLAGVKDLFYGRVAAASIFSDFSKKDLQPAL